MNTNIVLETVAKMPELPHSVPDAEFDVKNSEVVKWLIEQPDVLNWLFFKFRDLGALVYDPATGKWHGEPAVEFVPFTSAEIMAILQECGQLSFSEWRLQCETTYKRKSGMWDFVRSIKPLVDQGIVFKRGSDYRMATKHKA